MNKLIITSHPSSKGFTHIIANELKKLSEKKGDKVEIIDLYNTELKQDFLRYENKKEIGAGTDLPGNMDNNTKLIQNKIKDSDEIIFIFPIWWGDMPAIMKNFFDCNFTSGFAFKYIKEGKSVKQIGLLKGKTARIICTSGAPSFFYNIILHIQVLWNMNRIAFCGIKQKSFTIFGNMDKSEIDRSKYIKNLEKLV